MVDLENGTNLEKVDLTLKNQGQTSRLGNWEYIFWDIENVRIDTKIESIANIYSRR